SRSCASGQPALLVYHLRHSILLALGNYALTGTAELVPCARGLDPGAPLHFHCPQESSLCCRFGCSSTAWPIAPRETGGIPCKAKWSGSNLTSRWISTWR